MQISIQFDDFLLDFIDIIILTFAECGPETSGNPATRYGNFRMLPDRNVINFIFRSHNYQKNLSTLRAFLHRRF
jgi:hypothetical protein